MLYLDFERPRRSPFGSFPPSCDHSFADRAALRYNLGMGDRECF